MEKSKERPEEYDQATFKDIESLLISMKLEPMQSSRISGIGCLPFKGNEEVLMVVEFRKGGHRYMYKPVSKKVYDTLLNAEKEAQSLGQLFNKLIINSETIEYKKL